ncbi:MAG: PQQ-binding-like beta-propeller repeat protein [Nitrososphaera sp.]
MSKSFFSALIMGVILSSAGVMTQVQGAPATFESWDFVPSGEVLAMSTIEDLSRDGVADLIVAARDKSVYALDGTTGQKLWNYTANQYYSWRSVVTSPPLDANSNSKSDVLVATTERLVMMLDGAKGNQLWSFNMTDSNFKQGAACSMSVRSAHFLSDIDGDGINDSAVVSGTGDICAQKDKVSVLALSGKTGKQLWEYAKSEDYHGLKDGGDNSSPVAILDFNKDGSLDIGIADELGYLRVINGETGTEIRNTKLEVFGSIWDFTTLPDVSGDGIPDALAFEFIEGGGGPDYASIDAIDLMKSNVLWQAKVGDGRIDGGALFSAASLNGTGANLSDVIAQVAVTKRIENELTLVLLDAKTGEQKWQYRLGEERSRDDLSKVYPVARIATAGASDELAVGSIDSKLYLLNLADGSVIWSHGVTGEIGGMTFVGAPGGQKYVIVEESYKGVRALSRQTTIATKITIEQSAHTVVSESKILISGALQPAFPGELVEIRYVDPKGAVSTKPIVLSREGTFTDVFEPVMAGSWNVGVSFDGEGFYLGSSSPTIGFRVVDKVESLLYQLKVPDDESISYPIPYFVDGGHVDAMSINKETKTLRISINPSTADGSLKIDLPRSVIDAFESNYQVYVDGKVAQFQELEADSTTRSLSIPFKQGNTEITISGTYIVPEFSAIAPLLLAATMLATITVLGIRGRLPK